MSDELTIKGAIESLNIGPDTRLLLTVHEDQDLDDAEMVERLASSLHEWSGVPKDRILLVRGLKVQALTPESDAPESVIQFVPEAVDRLL